MTNRAAFFSSIRALFGGHLSQDQVDGMNVMLDTWSKWVAGNGDFNPNARWLAYALATAFHETDRTMQPIAEEGMGAGRDYGVPDPVTGLVYYGRGFVQLTWKANYQVQGARLGLPLETDPDLALRPDVASDIMLHGMAAGSFTGRRLGQYFGVDPAHDDPVNARRIINGTDHAATIATYHRAFARALATIQQKESPWI